LRRGRVIRLVLLLGVVVLVAAVVFTRFLPVPGGPLAGRAQGTTTATVGAGERYTVQSFVLENDSGRTVTLEEIDVAGLDDGVDLLGVDVARRALSVPTIAPGYPPPAGAGVLRRVDGAEIGERARVVFGVRPRRAGRNPRLDRVEVRYRDRGVLRSTVLDGRVDLRVR